MTGSAMTDPIRILTVDDHPLMREGIRAIVKSEADMLTIAEAASGEEAIELYRRHRPDVTLMDLRLPGANGIDTLILIRAEFPDARIIVLTTFEGDAEIRRAMESGARGYALKNMPRKTIVDIIRKVHAGRTVVPPEIAANLAEHLGGESLSQREIEVLQRVAAGNRNIDIARQLFISEETVKGHVKHVMEKLGARDRTEAVAIGIRRGMIHLDQDHKGGRRSA
jgi:DNA-binding NarL/FixJ family response regulator